METTPSSGDPAIAAEAREWVLLLASGEADANDIERLRAWLAKDANARAFERERGLWQELEQHQALFGSVAAVTGSARPHRRQPRPVWRAAHARTVLIGAVAAVAVLVFLRSEIALFLQADYRTAAGVAMPFLLPDGSRMVLDSRSAIDLQFSNSERRIALLRGRAWFEVAHDNERPFRVTARGGVTEDIGTAFEVGLEDRGVTVGVTEGRVKTIAADGENWLLLDAGQRAAYSDGGPVVRDSTIAIADIAAWRNGELLLDRLPLNEAIDSVARYRWGATLVLADLSDAPPVSGVFRTDQPDDALAAIAATAGLAITRLPGGVAVIHRP